MKCEKAKELILADYSDRSLGGEMLNDLEEHIKKCGSCRSFLKTIGDINTLLGKAERKPLPGYLYAKVLRRIEDEKRPSLFKLFADRRVLTPAFSLAAAVLLAVGTYFFAFSSRVHPLGYSNGLDQITYVYEESSADPQADKTPVNFGSAAEEFFL